MSTSNGNMLKSFRPRHAAALFSFFVSLVLLGAGCGGSIKNGGDPIEYPLFSDDRVGIKFYYPSDWGRLALEKTSGDGFDKGVRYGVGPVRVYSQDFSEMVREGVSFDLHIEEIDFDEMSLDAVKTRIFPPDSRASIISFEEFTADPRTFRGWMNGCYVKCEPVYFWFLPRVDALGNDVMVTYQPDNKLRDDPWTADDLAKLEEYIGKDKEFAKIEAVAKSIVDESVR